MGEFDRKVCSLFIWGKQIQDCRSLIIHVGKQAVIPVTVISFRVDYNMIQQTNADAIGGGY